MRATAGARSTSGVVEPPTAHGAALAWAGDARADPDPLVLRGVPRGDRWRALDIRCRRAALCTAASQKLQDLQEIADAIWAMAETGSQMPDVFEALCTAAPPKLQGLPEIADAL